VPRLSNSSRKGNSAEVRTAKWLEERGCLVASRRHTGGAGDLIAVHYDPNAPYSTGMSGRPVTTVWLIEVKANEGSPFMNFRGADRLSLVATAKAVGAEPYLAHWPRGMDAPDLIHYTDWPGRTS
jgi:hypothetical protein